MSKYLDQKVLLLPTNCCNSVILQFYWGCITVGHSGLCPVFLDFQNGLFHFFFHLIEIKTNFKNLI